MKWILIIFAVISTAIILSSIVVTIKDAIKDFKK
tara:strand:- start:1114 stop:1215 length:102 start_codon:yes stop_codon:yes gene_type:complete